MLIIICQMIRDPRQAGMNIPTSQFFGGHLFTSGGLHQGWAGEENSPLVSDNNWFIAHCRYVGSPSSARAHNHRNLSNAFGRHIGLVVKDATKMISVREYLILIG